MKRQIVPIRWRLTIWYGELIAAGLLLLGAAVYVGLRVMLVDSFNEQFDSQTRLATAAVVYESGVPRLPQAALDALTSDERFVRLFDATGAVLIDTGTVFGGAFSSPDEIATSLQGRAFTREAEFGGTPFRVRTEPLQAEGRIAGVIQVGLTSEDVDETLRLLLLTLFVAAPIVLLGSAAGGYLVAGRALAPVAAITALAKRIDAEAIDARLDLDLPDDELGNLARTFDEMLDRISEQVEREKRFTGDAAHELRTPVAAMRAEVDLALSRPRTVPEYRAALERLDRDLERITAQLGSLLWLARADARRLTLDRTRFDLVGSITSVAAQYGERGRAIATDTVPAVVEADPDMILQVLINLIENALAYTPEGGTVTLGCRAGTATVSFWVEDTGEGIPAEHLPHLFERFYRVDEGRTRERGGVGLGLSICRAIVEAHGGTIAVRSEVAQGTRVLVTLPA